MFEQQSSKLRPGLSTFGSLDSKRPCDRQCLPIASQVFSSQVKRTKSSLTGDRNRVPGRNRRNFNSKPGAVYRRNELRFWLKVSDILKECSQMDGVGRKRPKSVSGKEVLRLGSLMVIFPSWQSLLVQCRLPIIPLNY